MSFFMLSKMCLPMGPGAIVCLNFYIYSELKISEPRKEILEEARELNDKLRYDILMCKVLLFSLTLISEKSFHSVFIFCSPQFSWHLEC